MYRWINTVCSHEKQGEMKIKKNSLTFGQAVAEVSYARAVLTTSLFTNIVLCLDTCYLLVRQLIIKTC